MNYKNNIKYTLSDEKLSYFDDTILNTTDKVFNEVRQNNDIAQFNPNIRYDNVFKHKYLDTYYENINGIIQHYIKGYPDTFIEAACLCNALIKNKMISFDLNKKIPTDLFNINYQIALKAAMELIKKPTVFEEKRGNWQEETLLPCDIKIPEGSVPGTSFENRILYLLTLNDIYNVSTHSLLLAHFFHLLYQYNLKEIEKKPKIYIK